MAALLRTQLAAFAALEVVSSHAGQPLIRDSEREASLEGALEALSMATVRETAAHPVLSALACSPTVLAALCRLIEVRPCSLLERECACVQVGFCSSQPGACTTRAAAAHAASGRRCCRPNSSASSGLYVLC